MVQTHITKMQTSTTIYMHVTNTHLLQTRRHTCMRYNYTYLCDLLVFAVHGCAQVDGQVFVGDRCAGQRALGHQRPRVSRATQICTDIHMDGY